jgi:hypothetical protein
VFKNPENARVLMLYCTEKRKEISAANRTNSAIFGHITYV